MGGLVGQNWGGGFAAAADGMGVGEDWEDSLHGRALEFSLALT